MQAIPPGEAALALEDEEALDLLHEARHGTQVYSG